MNLMTRHNPLSVKKNVNTSKRSCVEYLHTYFPTHERVVQSLVDADTEFLKIRNVGIYRVLCYSPLNSNLI